MKHLLLTIMFVSLVTGCGSSTNIASTITSTEHGLSAGQGLTVSHTGIGVIELESSGSTPAENDTGTAGVDILTFSNTATENRTFCMEDDDGEPHTMKLTNPDGIEVANITADSDCATVSMVPGDYTMEITHGGAANDTVVDTIFIHPGTASSSKPTASSSGDIKIQASVSTNKQTLIKTNSCSNCDLTRANLSFAYLTRANLGGANLSFANLTGAGLSFANLSFANLTGADLQYAILQSATLTGATLGGATWIDGEECCCAFSIGRCDPDSCNRTFGSSPYLENFRVTS